MFQTQEMFKKVEKILKNFIYKRNSILNNLYKHTTSFVNSSKIS